MKTAPFSLLFFALQLCSCAQYAWTKAGVADGEFQRDLAEAQYHAQAATVGAFNSYSSPFLDQNQRMGESLANGVIRGLEQKKLVNMYLKMKGWEWVKVPQAKTAASQLSGHESGQTQYLEGPNEEVDEG